MTIKQRRILPAIVAAAIGTGASLALAADPAVEQMQQQIDALQAEIAQLKSTQQQQLNAADVDATIARVLEDANRRSQLLQVEGFTAGYTGGKFLLQSADGNFVLNPNFQFQLRHVVNAIDEDDDDWDVEHGFEIRRMRFGIAGNVFSKNLKYNVIWGSDRNGGSLSLEDAIVEYSFEGTPWSIYGGQYKAPVHHEELTSSKRQLAADRSLVNELLGGGFTDRVQGIGLTYEEGPLYATVTYHDSANSDNTDFTAPDHFGVAGRVEYVLFGDKKDYADFTAMGTTEDLLVIGGGFDWSEMGSFDIVSHTVDVQFENAAGLGLYAAYVAQWGEDDDDDFYDWGAVAQIAYLLPDSKWEVFGRFGWIDFENADDELIEITGGLNYYVHGHSAKFTVDLTYLPEGSPEVTGIGYLGSSDDEDQFVLRSQFQLLI